MEHLSDTSTPQGKYYKFVFPNYDVVGIVGSVDIDLLFCCCKCAVLCCAVLYCTVLCCTVLYCSVLLFLYELINLCVCEAFCDV